MKFKIGFSAETNNQNEETVISNDDNRHLSTVAPRRSVVEIFFPDRNITCSYYNDLFDLKNGNLVYVDGKLEGLKGRVVNISYTFKIKLSDYKRVIGVADTQVVGELHQAGSHLVTFDRNSLNYSKVITWFKAPQDEEEILVGDDGEPFNIRDLGQMKVSEGVANRGHEYYIDNHVAYIELDKGKGRAIVLGSVPYEVEFKYDNGQISGLVCGCYCTGNCKHGFATMLQLRETLDIIAENHPDADLNGFVAIVSKSAFFEFAFEGKGTGTLTLR